MTAIDEPATVTAGAGPGASVGHEAGGRAVASVDPEGAVAPAASTVRIRFGIAYDGTEFSGWSRQPTLRTVQGVLEEALETLFRRTGVLPRLTVAGRTDAGVHARGQVVHLDVPQRALATVARPRRGRAEGDTGVAGVLARRITGILGADADVVITSADLAPAGFDARFSALWRRYEYLVADASAVRDPLTRRSTVAYPKSLDVEAMDAAAGSLLGLHDFATFCRPRAEATTIRTLQRYGWRRRADGVLVASLQADAFCHSMVRALVGACVAVGEGRLDASDPLALLRATERTSAFKVMPAKGLVLTEVGYPEDDELEARATQTRARRELHVGGVIG